MTAPDLPRKYARILTTKTPNDTSHIPRSNTFSTNNDPQKNDGKCQLIRRSQHQRWLPVGLSNNSHDGNLSRIRHLPPHRPSTRRLLNDSCDQRNNISLPRPIIASHLIHRSARSSTHATTTHEATSTDFS